MLWLYIPGPGDNNYSLLIVDMTLVKGMFKFLLVAVYGLFDPSDMGFGWL